MMHYDEYNSKENIIKRLKRVHFSLDLALSPHCPISPMWIALHKAEAACLYRDRDLLLTKLKEYRNSGKDPNKGD